MKTLPNLKDKPYGGAWSVHDAETVNFVEDHTVSYPTVDVKKFLEDSDVATVSYYTLKGKLRSEGKMKGKNRLGKWMYYFSTGEIFSEEFYSEGLLEKTLKNYYKNGNLAEESEYKNGLN